MPAIAEQARLTEPARGPRFELTRDDLRSVRRRRKNDVNMIRADRQGVDPPPPVLGMIADRTANDASGFDVECERGFRQSPGG